jgi:chemotaxis protein MotB
LGTARAGNRLRIALVAGKAETQPLFPEDPHIAANRRVTITMLREAPPLPPGFKP